MESEFKAASALQKVEELELELSSLKDSYEQSQTELERLRASQDEIIELRCQELQSQLEEMTTEMESVKADLASSGKFCIYHIFCTQLTIFHFRGRVCFCS